MNPDPEKGIKCYIDSDFTGGQNQEEGKETGLVLSRTGYAITYANFPIKQVSRIQTEIALSKTKAEYIALSQAMRNVLPFVSIMKEIECVLKLQEYTPAVLCSIKKNIVTVYKNNQGAIALVVSP